MSRNVQKLITAFHLCWDILPMLLGFSLRASHLWNQEGFQAMAWNWSIGRSMKINEDHIRIRNWRAWKGEKRYPRLSAGPWSSSLSLAQYFRHFMDLHGPIGFHRIPLDSGRTGIAKGEALGMKESKWIQISLSAGVPAVAGAQSVMSSKPSIPQCWWPCLDSDEKSGNIRKHGTELLPGQRTGWGTPSARGGEGADGDCWCDVIRAGTCCNCGSFPQWSAKPWSQFGGFLLFWLCFLTCQYHSVPFKQWQVLHRWSGWLFCGFLVLSPGAHLWHLWFWFRTCVFCPLHGASLIFLDF